MKVIVFLLCQKVSRLFGFEEVDFPVLESEALFIRKAGEEIRDQVVFTAVKSILKLNPNLLMVFPLGGAVVGSAVKSVQLTRILIVWSIFFWLSLQLYCFEDRGNRRVALRPELTPSLARLVIQKGYNYILMFIFKMFIGFQLVIYLMTFVSRYGCLNLILMFFLVQKICITAIEMVCCRTVLAIWENDKGTAPWTLPVEYGYYWCTWSNGVSYQMSTRHAFSSFEQFYFCLKLFVCEHDFYVLSIHSHGRLEVISSSTGV